LSVSKSCFEEPEDQISILFSFLKNKAIVSEGEGGRAAAGISGVFSLQLK